MSFSTPGCISSPRAVDLLFATTSTRLHSTDNKQSEIAALEERLRQLKEQEFSPINPPAIRNAYLPIDSTDNELDGMEGETEESIMFSERWKEVKNGYLTKQQESNIGWIGKIGLALGLVVFLGIFSQVPIGEESLQKYQAVKGNPSRIYLGDLNPVQEIK
ncbi:hypothetical protein ACHAXA_001555 [Cyclostephanos tholiformis]|uniref:Uncharacterized protein n=1 Tax=Cyclostephanos tholiformis TaxID=382380 RepID=A0ABD3R417_9STRA